MLGKFAAAFFVVAALVGPAIAQAPPPVPGLPDTERRTAYSISAATGPYNVNFALYGDTTDYGAWIEVWLDGVILTPITDWTLALTSGSLATAARPLTNAQVTLTTARTGTLQIVGARRPRRTSQFLENRGIAARDLNQVITDIVSQNREIWDKINDFTGRTILGGPGETFGVLPAPAARAGLILCFDGGGAVTLCNMIAGSIAPPLILNGLSGAQPVITINPLPNSLGRAIAISQTPAGTAIANTPATLYPNANTYSLNSISVANDISGLSGGTINGLSIVHSYGGGTVLGNKQGLYVQGNLFAASGNANGNYVAGTFFQAAGSNDGGGAGTERGSFFGMNPVCFAYAAAIHIRECAGMEVDVGVETGAAVLAKAGISIVQLFNDAVQGSLSDAAIWISNQSGAVGWKNGILFSNNGAQIPFSATGCILCTSGAAAIAKGIDISSYTYSGNSIAAPNFNVTQAGIITSNALGATSFVSAGQFLGVGTVIRTGTNAPSLSACGTSPAINGSDLAGEVTMGTGTPAGCVITFFTNYAAVPFCSVTWQATPLASQSFVVAADKITLTQTATSSNKVTYHCFARSGG